LEFFVSSLYEDKPFSCLSGSRQNVDITYYGDPLSLPGVIVSEGKEISHVKKNLNKMQGRISGNIEEESNIK
jgi:hypothetical protein